MSTTARTFTIATAPNRFAKSWKTRRVSWEKFLTRFTEPSRSNEKDQGGYVGGYLRDGIRKSGHAERRAMITLDLDDPADDLGMMLDAVLDGYTYVLHETFSSTPESPRYRLVVPLAADLSAEQYVPAALKLMEQLGMEQFDPTTAQPERLMYWPTRRLGADYQLDVVNGALLDGEALLAEYPDWKDSTCWPEVGHTYRTEPVTKASDPREKHGIVGAFNRAYTIDLAIEEFLTEVYERAPGGRWTFLGGHTVGGLAVYNDGLFAFSNHGSDPAAGQNLSAFDLVRVHLFGHLDQKSGEDTPITKLPSQAAMLELAGRDANVRVELDAERHHEAADDFAEDIDDDELEAPEPLTPKEARDKLSMLLSRNNKGDILPTAQNIALILDMDPELSGIVGHDQFSHRLKIRRDSLPWRAVTREDPYWIDEDDAGLRVWMETHYGIVSAGKVADALTGAARRGAFHPVRDYLDTLTWDGTERLDTLLVDYLGAEDTDYTRTVTRKMLVAAVARVRRPGVKFDHMLVTTGPQGIGKSMVPQKLAQSWFKDAKIDLGHKDALEALSGAWIFEFAELSATKKAEVETVKHFITIAEDNFRASYAKRSEHRPRQVVFWGTSNERDFLRDRTGNRRFWPVQVTGQGERKPWHLTQDIVDQLWAEAVFRYEDGEPLTLNRHQSADAKAAQLRHTEGSELDGMIAEYLTVPVPSDWYKMGLEDRRAYMREAVAGGDVPDDAMLRDKVCSSEVCVELLGERPGSVHPAKAASVRSALDALEGWSRAGKARFGPGYGIQVAWVRDVVMPEDDLLG